MYNKPPNRLMTKRYSKIRSNPSSSPNRDCAAEVPVITSPTTVVGVAPVASAASVVSVVTSSVKLNVPKLPMLRLITQVTVHCPAGGSEASGVDTVCMSTAITGAPSETVTPLHRSSTPSAAASSASSLFLKMSCSCVGTTLTVELGCGFDEISSLGIVDAACDVAGNPVISASEPTTASSSENRARRPRSVIARMGVVQRYPSVLREAAHTGG